jgi:hypothetical protein
MRCYKFRNRSLDPLQKRVKSWRKLGYLASKNKLRLLDSFNYESQTWGALHKAWVGYIIGKNKFELDKMEYYASVIQKLQKELGLQISSFPDLNLPSLDSSEENAELMSEEISEEELSELMAKRSRRLASVKRRILNQNISYIVADGEFTWVY